MSDELDDIIITDSRDLNDNQVFSSTNVKNEGDEESMRTLESQGISILNKKDVELKAEPRDQFTKKLKEEGDIEIVQNEVELDI